MLVRGKAHCNRITRLASSFALIVAGGILAPVGAVAQHPAATAAAPVRIGEHREADHRDHAERTGRGQPEGKLAEQERDDRRLRAAYEERLNSLSAAIIQRKREEMTEARRRQQADDPAHDRRPRNDAGLDHDAHWDRRDSRWARDAHWDRSQENGSPAIADHVAHDRGSQGDPRADRQQFKDPRPIPGVRPMGAQAPRYPHGGAVPNIAVLGGAAPRDPKKGNILDGAAIHRKL
jgi:hypothetical protein